MNEIIKVNYDGEQPIVFLRDLYGALEIKERFSTWTERLLNYFGSEEMTSVFIPTEVQNNRGVQVRKLQNYVVSTDTAKHICLMSRTEKGRQCRQYLIELEKAWNTPEQVMARALKMADKTIDRLKNTNIALLEDVNRMKPKEVFADAISASNSTMLIRDVAKLIRQNGVPLGEKRFYKWLRENGYICKGSTSPTQRAMELGLFEVVVRIVEKGDGLPIETKTTKITGKGQQYFINKFLTKEELA